MYQWYLTPVDCLDADIGIAFLLDLQHNLVIYKLTIFIICISFLYNKTYIVSMLKFGIINAKCANPMVNLTFIFYQKQ